MPGSDVIITDIQKCKENYESKIEFAFIQAPVTDEGGFAYISPSNAIAVNKYSNHMDWALEFMNFFFSEENNKIYAEASHMTSNTKDALEQVSKKYHISINEIGQPNDVTFGDYNFYNFINPILVAVSKGNNPKYMQEDGTMYPFSYYMDTLHQAFKQQRELMEE